ncbi:putative histidine acid phosphatase [Aspergillus saccharolyticus JOP 1030-1]|uniref:Phosphoglycerate mutase-like protein n=1 Tax=Aspergillus saccharolyticus JOP 1030-1 TaxID=1450539 RepID=A0A318ZBA3_9EURO|nr:phosphoglycerate mutase-like protein [Aspergillus saccharolyticus JOP 1030-1]PYH44721.1 phosphoglycerate mutase-like protein [Aspergillus saccharolyticus JOP 1030-1]
MKSFVTVLALSALATTSTGIAFNPLHHLAGITPYYAPQDPPIDPKPHPGCNVTRAAYLVRHAAIYANDFDYESYIEPFVEKLRNTTQDWNSTGALSFLRNWSAPIDDEHLEKLTRVGLQEATTLGVKLHQHYPTLRAAKVWASTAERTVKSAEGFINGYTNNQSSAIGLVQVAESKSTGADSLTPYKACPAYSSSYGSDQSSEFIEHYTRPITARLDALAPKFNFTSDDVTAMFELCGYETVIRGFSPFCSLSLFTSAEWLSFEYANDIMYFYNTGYGRPLSPHIGLPWAQASWEMVSGNTNASDTLYVSFTHRELPPTVVTALGLFNNSAFTGADNINTTMPLDQVNYNRAWKSSHILPFLGNIAIERLECDVPGFEDPEYYRVLVNSAPQPLVGCRDGPGESCSREGFSKFLKEREELYGDFGGACGNDSAVETLNIYN